MSSTPTFIEKKLLHYTGKAIADFNMIQRGDRVMVCLSGGKDSFTLLTLLHSLKRRSNHKFDLFAFTLDQAQPGWDDRALHAWLQEKDIPYEILTRDTYSIVKEKIPEGKTYCSLCSRLRRGIIYRYAEENGFTKIALGHHRDDLIRSLMMSILYNGDIRSMPPKLLSDNKKHIVIRPLAYVQEKDIMTFANEQAFPIIPCTLCGSQENLARKKIGKLIDQLAEENPKIPSNMLHALQSVKPSQLMDQDLWQFKNLESELLTAHSTGEAVIDEEAIAELETV
ncbi:C32 tRNA thiolase [Legionella quinlivanii]|uniref:tRNA-cytidine(32) 2-sulfurtransferase n=1 Tax=Legionella quinlivanii TaxID=45073 RepID=A0A0W0XNH6_9GAMM|nr:tRNA 2-thiocytidine(32) synthetase TtcA [Legionella quinlivanii]KTD46124.1 C32 tRNA thiolase [Legionella quinlivanii]MCW8451187.1 tRNA 2-thiocytidine(32) synthetase TtcA [Legionella quinlivanii]SEG28096.1 tRNA 2-thiocytidine biosynthesis protein TtcA [Legionella quinlivanii DSM 21216]STY10622.1 C32 tRNA thiolase [Legionella quinlivanii]